MRNAPCWEQVCPSAVPTQSSDVLCETSKWLGTRWGCDMAWLALGWGSRVIESFRLKKISKVIYTNPNPSPLTTSLRATSMWFWNTSRDDDSTTSLESLFQILQVFVAACSHCIFLYYKLLLEQDTAFSSYLPVGVFKSIVHSLTALRCAKHC